MTSVVPTPDLLFVAALSFAAGMVAFFSPCCAAMMPAYVSYALGRAERAAPPATPAVKSRARRELGAICVWGGLLIAALGLGRIALYTLGGAITGWSSTAAEHRTFYAALAGLGTLIALAGYAATAERSRFLKALAFGALATAGLLLVFVLIAFPLAAAGAAAGATLVVLAVGVGIVLIGLGVLMFVHKLPALRIPLFDPTRAGFAGFFLYGIAYGLASIACTFPIFLSIVVLAAFFGPVTLLVAVVSYALGKGAVLTLITVLATASPTAVEGKLRKMLPHFEGVMAGITIGAGAFIVYYFGVLYAPA